MAGQQTVVDLFRERRFEEAAGVAEEIFRTGDRSASILALRPAFGDPLLLKASEIFFSRVAAALETAGSAEASLAAENLADVLHSNGKTAEAAAVRRRHYDRLPSDSTDRMRARERLAMLYRILDDRGALDDLYSDIGLCAHLEPVLRVVMATGARIQYCGQAWSANCHIWVYFDTVLDCENLQTIHNLPGCVEIHDHRGTHDGAERGLVCREHHDGLMGTHPAYSGFR